MVTGWNEWIAGRFSHSGEDVSFIDQFNEEFSRDIEMVKGGHADNYYYELVANVRKFKGMPALRRASPEKSISTDNDFAQWRDVEPEYYDHIFSANHHSDARRSSEF